MKRNQSCVWLLAWSALVQPLRCIAPCNLESSNVWIKRRSKAQVQKQHGCSACLILPCCALLLTMCADFELFPQQTRISQVAAAAVSVKHVGWDLRRLTSEKVFGCQLRWLVRRQNPELRTGRGGGASCDGITVHPHTRKHKTCYLKKCRVT